MEYDADQVSQIRELAHARLQRLCQGDNFPTESFVFKDDRFCGMRFRIGLVYAQWMLGDDLLEFFREGKLIDQIRLGAPVRRAA